MTALRCPKCGSSRVKRGYVDPPVLLRAIGVYNLLCDNCNLLFRGFAVPGTVPPRGRRHEAAHGGRAEGALTFFVPAPGSFGPPRRHLKGFVKGIEA